MGNADYTAAPQVQRTIVVSQALLTVTANSFTRAYGAANPTLTVSYSGFVNPDGPSVLTGSPSLSTTAAATSLPGSYPITVTRGNPGSQKLHLQICEWHLDGYNHRICSVLQHHLQWSVQRYLQRKPGHQQGADLHLRGWRHNRYRHG